MSEEMIQVNCPSCGQAVLAPTRMAGRILRCRKCGGHIQLPGGAPPSAAAAAAAVAPPPPSASRPPVGPSKTVRVVTTVVVVGLALAVCLVLLLQQSRVSREKVLGHWESTFSAKDSYGRVSRDNLDGTFDLEPDGHFTFNASRDGRDSRMSGTWELSEASDLTLKNARGGSEIIWHVNSADTHALNITGDDGTHIVWHR